MKIFINDQLEEQDVQSLKQLIDFYSLESKVSFAVAVNDEVIPQSRWSDYQLQENDHVLILQAIQGG